MFLTPSDISIENLESTFGEVPGSPVAKTPHSECTGSGFILVGELGSHMLQLRLMQPNK